MLVPPSLEVFFIALFITCLCRQFDLDDDDVEEDEEGVIVADESEWYRVGTRRENTGQPVPVDEEYLDLVRKARQKEVEMW